MLELPIVVDGMVLTQDAVSYTTAINACRKGSLWQEAIYLCREMRLQHVQPDIVTFGPFAAKYSAL